MHRLHALLACLLANRPSVHTRHVLAFTREYTPVVQFEQNVLPFSEENAPDGHELQLAAAGAPELVENVPVEQFRHVPDVVWPVPVAYFPGVHRMHACTWTAPVPVEYVPAWHVPQTELKLKPVPVD